MPRISRPTRRHRPPDRPSPTLVIVVDEFRILVDEAPGALSELMRIAAIGRSLGIHLIMATQRPQGALNADIRANVTTCIALRVQSGPESFDVMGSGLAAAIPIARPGRAFLIRGAQAPEEFQTATLTPRADPRSDGTVTVRTATDELTRPPAAAGLRADGSAGREADDGAALAPVPAPALTPALTPAQGAAALIDAAVAVWQDLGARQAPPAGGRSAAGPAAASRFRARRAGHGPAGAGGPAGTPTRHGAGLESRRAWASGPCRR